MERGARMERRGGARRGTRRRLGCRAPAHRAVARAPAQVAEAGLTLIELVIAISVFAVMAGGIASTASSGLNLIRNDRNRSVAANLASQEMDEIRQTTFSALPLSGLTTSTKTVDGVSYDVERQFDFVSTTATTSMCDSVGGIPKLLRATVQVRWNAMGSIPPVQSNTVITPPVGSFDPNLGHIAVKLSDRDPGVLPENISGVTVHLTGPSTDRTLNTTAEGCAFFDHLAVGTYTVQLAGTGYVDRQGVATPDADRGRDRGRHHRGRVRLRPGREHRRDAHRGRWRHAPVVDLEPDPDRARQHRLPPDRHEDVQPGRARPARSARCSPRAPGTRRSRATAPTPTTASTR